MTPKEWSTSSGIYAHECPITLLASDKPRFWSTITRTFRVDPLQWFCSPNGQAALPSLSTAAPFILCLKIFLWQHTYPIAGETGIVWKSYSDGIQTLRWLYHLWERWLQKKVNGFTCDNTQGSAKNHGWMVESHLKKGPSDTRHLYQNHSLSGSL